MFHSCEDIACIEWGHISDKIRNRLFAQPEQFANVILGFLKRLQDSLYAIDWALVEKLAQKTFCCLLVKIDLAAAALPGSSITSNVDITRLFQSIENSVSISDVPMCFKAIFAAGVKLGKVHAPLIPNNGSKVWSDMT